MIESTLIIIEINYNSKYKLNQEGTSLETMIDKNSIKCSRIKGRKKMRNRYDKIFKKRSKEGIQQVKWIINQILNEKDMEEKISLQSWERIMRNY